MSKRYSFKTSEEAKALMELTALRLGTYPADLIHGFFEQLALETIDDIPDDEIRRLFSEATIRC